MQETLIHYQECPVCGHTDLQPALTAIDYTVSHKTFSIVQCTRCTLRFTQDVPDGDSIGHYYRSEDYISHTETSEGLVNRLYHMVRRQTLSDKSRLISLATRQGQGALLDIGAGTGAFAHFMHEKGWTVTGLEPDEAARDRAKSARQVNLLPMEELYLLPPDHFTAITLWHVLEHVHDLHPYMDQLKKILKPGGRTFIAVPNYTSYDATRYRGFWAAYDVPRHLYHFSPDSIDYLLDSHQLQLHATRAMWYDSFYISLLSEKYRNGNGKGNMLSGFLTGAVSNLKAFVDKSKCSSLIYVIGK